MQLLGHTGRVTGVAFGALPDGRMVLASSSYDHTVRLWDPAAGTPIGDPLTFSDQVTGVAVGQLPDGSMVLVSSSEDKTVRVEEFRVDGSRDAHTYSLAPLLVRCLSIASGAIFIGTSEGLVALNLTGDD